MSKLNYFLKLISEGSVGGVILTAALMYLFNSYNLSWLWGLSLALVIYAMNALLTGKPEITALIVSRRLLTTIIVLVASGIVGFLMLRFTTIPSKSLSLKLLYISQFFAQGLVVGVVVRMLLGIVFVRTLFGASVQIQKNLLLLALAVFFWLFPFEPSHKYFAGIYIIGFGIGFIVHLAVRREKHSNAERNRKGQTIIRMLESENNNLKPIQEEAINYYARQNWKKLSKLIKKNQQNLSTVLVIVNALMLRTRGDYEKILVNIERELNNDKRNKKLDTYLHLSKTLALGELNDMDKMFISLDEAQETSKKILRTDCLLAKATLSLRLAEQIPLDGTDQKPLREIWTALNLHAKNASADLMAVVFGTAVPVTWTFLLDAYGYSLLKAGHKKFSKSFLTYCIIEDPGFSSPYLHLGEWYKIDAMTESNSTDIEKNERSHRLATLCFQLALKLEGNKDSLIRRRAQSLLDQQKKSGK